MTAWGFIATLMALVLAVMAVRLSRHRALAPRRRPTSRPVPRSLARPAPSEAGNDVSRADAPTRLESPPGGKAEDHRAKDPPRQPLADAIFKIYTGEDMEERAREATDRAPSEPPPPALRSSDWA